MLAARDADNVAVARFHSAAVIAAEDDGHAIAFADGFDGRDDGASVGIDKDFAQLAETAAAMGACTAKAFSAGSVEFSCCFWYAFKNSFSPDSVTSQPRFTA